MAFAASKATASRTPDPAKEDTLRSFKPKPYRGVSVKQAVLERTGGGLSRLNGITGTTGAGKSSMVVSTGWLNLKYKAQLDNDITKIHFPKVIKLLQKGIIPEVEHIGIVESDMKSVEDFASSEWKKKFGRLIEDDVIDVAECFIISKEEKTKNGKPIKSFDPIIEQERDEYESACVNYEKDDKYQVVALDNASDYSMVLEETAENTYGDKETWFWYNKRKKWFFDFIAVAKASKKMHWFVFRLKEQLDFVAKLRAEKVEYNQVFEEPWYRIEWPGDTGYKMDNVYLATREYISNKFSITHKKGPWPMNPSILTMPNDPFLFPRVLEASADMLLEEYDPKKFDAGEKFW